MKKRVLITLTTAVLPGALAFGLLPIDRQVSAWSAESSVSEQPGSESSAPAGLKPVMAPEQFFGQAEVGYNAARQCPEIIAKLFCYCGCDLTDSHTSLLDCFTSDHGADCEICQGEAILALKLKKQGKSLAEIQQCVDEKFAKEYPFEHPTQPLTQYRQSRLWKPTKPENNEPPGKTAPSSTPPKLRTGKKAGRCCGNKSTPQQ